MACYHPLSGFRSKEINPKTGKRSLVFNPEDGFRDLPVKVPCGQCIGCRLERSRQWAIRCVHEASLYEQNCFLTLTYRDKDLPHARTGKQKEKTAVPGSLFPKDFVNFMKRYRKHVAKPNGQRIRFFHCGEYGKELGRAHYHAIIFNHDFEDKRLHTVRNGFPLYTSKTLAGLWPWGFSSIGECTFESAAYVARYIVDKYTGDQSQKHYELIDYETGEVHDRIPEYVTMSRRPGIATDWLKQYKNDVYPNDYVVLRGKKMRPPKFYDSFFEVTDPETFKSIKRERKLNSKQHADNNTPDRLRVREKCQQARLNRLPRNLGDQP